LEEACSLLDFPVREDQLRVKLNAAKNAMKYRRVPVGRNGVRSRSTSSSNPSAGSSS
jgi:hypothetical protein